MSEIKQYNYLYPVQRKLVLINALITGIILTLILSEGVWLYRTFFPYTPSFETVLSASFVAIFAGNLLANLLYRFIRFSRVILIISEVFFAALALVFFLKGVIFHAPYELINALIQKSPYFPIILLSLVPFFAGMKFHYFLRISCGKFFDEKKGAAQLIFVTLAGLASGLLLYKAYATGNYPYYLNLVPVIASIVLSAMTNLNYAPETIFAKDMVEEPKEDEFQFEHRDDLLFNYLNFSYISIYIYLAYLASIKFGGDFIDGKSNFLLITMVALSCGFAISALVKRAFWHVYADMLYPFLFILYYIALVKYGNDINYNMAGVFFIPAAFLFGFALQQTIANVLARFDQEKSHNILNISLFIIPIPLVTALNFIPFTNLWFFIMFYMISIINLVLPGIHLTQRRIAEYKKGVYLLLILFTIPFFIYTHLKLEVKVDSERFIKHINGFDALSNINFNSDYIPADSELLLNGKVIMKLSNLEVQNFKRAITAHYLFASSDIDRAFFIDGYRPFFSNNTYLFYKNNLVLNYIPEYLTDYRVLPVSGKKSPATDNSDLLTYLAKSTQAYSLIADMPNLVDQRENIFRFSPEYFRTVKKRLAADGIYSLQMSLNRAEPGLAEYAIAGIKGNFREIRAFLFGDHLMIVACDKAEKLMIQPDALERVRVLLSSNEDASVLFYDEYDLLSHMIVLNDLKPHNDPFTGTIDKSIINTAALDPARIAEFDTKHDYFANYISADKPDFKNMLLNQAARDKDIITTLKFAEKYEGAREFVKEIEVLNSLKRFADYNPALKIYLTAILKIKEKGYIQEAQRLEKLKRWDEASKIYSAVLMCNPSSYDAYYKLGLISLTLQDIDKAFANFQLAMKIDSSKVEVIYQVGILLIAKGDYKQALEYLVKADELKLQDKMLFFYIALCYEMTNNLQQAEQYYKTAYNHDPNNDDVKSALERIARKLTTEKDKWKSPKQSSQLESEKGETIMLPIIESATKIRLNDTEEKEIK